MSDFAIDIVDVQELLDCIEQQPFSETIQQWIYKLTRQLSLHGLPEKRRKAVLKLLDHPHYLVRYEVALLIHNSGEWYHITEKQRYSVLFGLQEFKRLAILARNGTKEDVKNAKKYLVRGMLDPHPPTRLHAVRYWNSATDDPWLKVVCAIASETYHQLPELVHALPGNMKAINAIQTLASHPLNSTYSQRQFQQVLDILGKSADSHQNETHIDDTSATPVKMPRILNRPNGPEPDHSITSYLKKQQIWHKNQWVIPDITQSELTGRIYYSNPAVQNRSQEQRKAEFTPPKPAGILSLDVQMLEPRVQSWILYEQGYISVGHIPGDYSDLIATDHRQAAKKHVNRLIHGGLQLDTSLETQPVTECFTEFGFTWLSGLHKWQADFVSRVQQSKEVHTLSGRRIPVDITAKNWKRQALNRLIQGSAVDIIYQALTNLLKNLPDRFRCYVLLHDELWIEASYYNLVQRRAILGHQFQQALQTDWCPVGFQIHQDLWKGL